MSQLMRHTAAAPATSLHVSPPDNWTFLIWSSFSLAESESWTHLQMRWCNIRFCICHCVDSVQTSMEVKTVSAQFYRRAQHQVWSTWSSNGHLIRATITVLSHCLHLHCPPPCRPFIGATLTQPPHSTMCSWYFSMALCLHKNVKVLNCLCL